MKRITTLFFITLITLLCACTSQVAKKLDQIETYIRQHPDSALAQLRSIDTNNLDSKALKAHYSLLYSTALDKNYIDTTDVSVIQPAVDYYDDGDIEHYIQTYYYLGRIQQNAGNNTAAMLSYTTALDNSTKSEDYLLKGMLHSIIAILYSSGYNSEQALYHGEKAYSCFLKTTDSRAQWIQLGALADYYGRNRNITEADSLYKRYMSMAVLDTNVYAKSLFQYARMLASRKPTSPEKSIEIFNLAKTKYNGKPKIEDYFFYAYALEQINKTSEANYILNKFQSFNSASSNYYRYRILRRRGNLSEALPYLEASVTRQDSIIISNLHQSLEFVQKAYFSQKAQFESERREVTKTRLWLILTLITMLICVILATWYRTRQNLLDKLERINSLKEDAEKQLLLLNDSEDKDNIIRKDYLSKYKNHYQLLNNLCAAYLSPARIDPKEKIFREVETILKDIADDKEHPSRAEIIVNKEQDNLLLRLREDFPSFSENDFKLIALSIMGFEAKTISLLMNYTVKTVYGKRDRIKRRIASSKVKARQEYLSFLS